MLESLKGKLTESEAREIICLAVCPEYKECNNKCVDCIIKVFKQSGIIALTKKEQECGGIIMNISLEEFKKLRKKANISIEDEIFKERYGEDWNNGNDDDEKEPVKNAEE